MAGRYLIELDPRNISRILTFAVSVNRVGTNSNDLRILVVTLYECIGRKTETKITIAYPDHVAWPLTCKSTRKNIDSIVETSKTGNTHPCSKRINRATTERAPS